MAVIVGFVSQKGGVGKSTLARALAREGASGGLKVKVADLDTQQGTLVNWQRRRLSAGLEPTVSVESFRTAAEPLTRANSYDLVIVDGPARASAATLAIARAADIIVQPTGASLDDLEPAVLTFHELIREGISREKLVFALCRVGTEAEERDCRAFLGEAGYVCLEGSLPERPGYRSAQNMGFAVTETKYHSLQKRAEQLIQALIDRIG
ncbi:MAG: AAA family ATPase [Halobacteriota archaeon]